MPTINDSLDLYTLWKRNEQQFDRRPSLSNAIPFKSDTSKFLVPSFSQVFFTDGYSSFKQDTRYERTVFEDEMEVPSIGTDQQNFDTAEMITFDIDGDSTRLPLMCKMIIYQQGATHEREPPILVRDVCIQWDGIDRQRSDSADSILLTQYENNTTIESGLRRARSSDYLLDGSTKLMNGRNKNILYKHNRSVSMASSMTEDDDTSSVMSVMTAGGTIQHRVSHILHRHKYSRQIDTNILGRQYFYSVPFYQYRGRRFGQQDADTQVNKSDLIDAQRPDFSLDQTLHFDADEKNNNNNNHTVYSVTLIIPIHQQNKNDFFVSHPKNFHARIPVNLASPHTTIGYIYTRQFVTIKRTIAGQPIDD